MIYSIYTLSLMPKLQLETPGSTRCRDYLNSSSSDTPGSHLAQDLSTKIVI